MICLFCSFHQREFLLNCFIIINWASAQTSPSENKPLLSFIQTDPLSDRVGNINQEFILDFIQVVSTCLIMLSKHDLENEQYNP